MKTLQAHPAHHPLISGDVEKVNVTSPNPTVGEAA
jgi:hypothetical protein